MNVPAPHRRPLLRLALSSMTLGFVALVTIVGCRRMLEIVDASDNAPNDSDVATAQSASDQPSSPGYNRDLIGASHGLQDVALIGLAASDLRQHTTNSEGADFDPAIDANGTVIVFASTRYSTNSHLFTKSVTGATITQVTDGPHNDAQPCFDPTTGTRIAFASDRAGQWDIWIVDVNGRNPIQVTNDPMPEMHPSWSPNGDRVAFSRVDAAKGTSTIWMADLNQPGVKRLIGEGMFPTWSPDGRRIAYQRAKARGSRWYSIWTVELREDEVLFPTEVASRTDAAVISPAWSPDGTQLAFSMLRGSVIDGLSTMADIGVVGADGRGLMRLTTGSAENHGPAWGADGRIYFSSRADDSETIWSVKPFRVPSYDPSPSATTSDTRRAAFAEDATAE